MSLPPPPADPISLTLYFSNMLQTSAPSGQENIAPSVYLLAIVNAIFRASAFSVFSRPANENLSFSLIQHNYVGALAGASIKDNDVRSISRLTSYLVNNATRTPVDEFGTSICR